METDLFVIRVKTSLLMTGTSENYAGKITSSTNMKQTCQKKEGSLSCTRQRKIFKWREIFSPTLRLNNQR